MALRVGEFQWNKVSSVLSNLSLTSVTIGDYIVVLNSKYDAVISEEPYLALQLWFNLKSGKIIKRIWGQTVGYDKVVCLAQLREACLAHFKGKPCIGSLEGLDEFSWQDFVISQSPVPRKISSTCQMLLDPRLSHAGMNVRSEEWSETE